jgi:hypothetical protein
VDPKQEMAQPFHNNPLENILPKNTDISSKTLRFFRTSLKKSPYKGFNQLKQHVG